jgi:hypothetical protein
MLKYEWSDAPKNSSLEFELPFAKLLSRVARFFPFQIYQNGKNVTNVHKLYQTGINYTKWP